MATRTVSNNSLVEGVKNSLILSALESGDAMTEASLCKRLKVIRSALEGVAARLAASKIQPKDLERLAQLVSKRDDAAKQGNPKAVDQYDIDFHQTIIDVADNGCVRDIVRNMHLYDRIFRYPASPYSVYDEHQDYSHAAIIAALASGDPDKAEDLIKRHIQAAKKCRVEALIGKVNLFE